MSQGKGYSVVLKSVNNKYIVRTLYFSQKYVSWSHFLTYTCNQETNFGESPIKNWIDSGECKINHPNIYNLELNEKRKSKKRFLIHPLGYCCMFGNKYSLYSLIIYVKLKAVLSRN